MRLRILFLFAGLIAYGSLYPFHFMVPQPHSAAWVKLFHDWSPLTSKADALGNIALFVPFGGAGVFAVARRAGLPFRIAAIALVSFALALVLQVAQIYVPGRTASLGDVIWNMVGSGAGMVAGVLAGGLPRAPWRRGWPGASAALPLGLIALWLTAELLPFVPSLDLQSIRTNLKPLLYPTLAPEQLVFHAAAVVIAGRALASMVGEAQSLRWLPALAGAAAAAKVFIVTRTLDVSSLAGLTLGCVFWLQLARWREPRRGTALVVLLFFAYAFGALMPFELRNIPEPFNLLPFAGLLRGSMLVNSTALAANLCLYAGILGVIRMNRVSPVPASIALAVLVALFEAIQTYLVGRTPDITEPLLVLLTGQMLRVLPLPSPLPAPERHAPAEMARSIARPIARAAPGAGPPAAGFNLVGWSARLGIACAATAFAFTAVLKLPQVPYNVAELFLGDGAFPFLAIFALALLWVGAGARLVGHYVGQSARPWLSLPLFAFGAGIVSLLLLCASVTQESIGDISGSNNLYWFVINKDIWGEWGRRLFLLIGSPDVVAFFERPVRYAALYGPLVTILALMFAGIEMHRGGRLDAGRVAPLVLSALLWLWLCKAIAFDWSSTDNLNELIARDGSWGRGGAYLYALLGVICANAVLLARMPLTLARSAVAAGVTLALVPIGWWLLNLGLEQHVQKYGLEFSGPQFLLGPDRKNLLGPEVLFLRWSVMQFAGVLVIAAGAKFAEPLIGRRAQRGERFAAV